METKVERPEVSHLAAAAGVRGRVAKVLEALLALDALTMDEKAGLVADVHRGQMAEEGMTEGVVVQVTAWVRDVTPDLVTRVVKFEAKPGHVLATAEALELVLRSIDPALALKLAREVADLDEVLGRE